VPRDAVVAFAVPGGRRLSDPIDHLLALDPGGRGIAGFFVVGGALGAAGALVGAERVLIATGFLVAKGMPETDGPPGAAVLGRALRRLGAHVRYTSDSLALPPLEAALRALGEPPDVFAYPESADAARDVLAREQPTHLVAIERPGRGREGDYLNAQGVSVAAWNVPLDEMFVRARRAGRPVTIGVGDGGNEIGMGCVRTRLAREGALMARIACVVPVDHLVVAGISNWGAYGIVAQLGRLTGKTLLHTPAEERELIDACVGAGASDGLTRRREPTVDALDADTHAAMVALLGLSWGQVSTRGERA
jgi:D-glutamate cyclase-like, C-terminal